ncbi:MAG: hypothetical protein MJ198_00250 [Bacteroidales bacterium]|nr:hypothetical protein [Bacteroidales bacterium]
MYKIKIWEHKNLSYDPYDEKDYNYWLNKLNNASVSLSETCLTICANGECINVNLSLYEKDNFTTSWVGVFPDGNKYRIVKPSDLINKLFLLQNPDAIDGFTLGTMNPQGWSISLKLLK